MSAKASIRAVASTCVESARVFLRDVGNGLLEVSHNMLALLGLLLVAAAEVEDELRAILLPTV